MASIGGIRGGPWDSPWCSGALRLFWRPLSTQSQKWYSAAERKAQLLLTADGAFVTIVFGALIGNAGITHANPPRGTRRHDLLRRCRGIGRRRDRLRGPLDWSLHGKADSELSRLGVDPEVPCSYKAEALWYFGHFARLRHDATVSALRQAGQETETEALSFNVVDGWALTAASLIALVGATAGLLASA
jgi:hypothetical protein